MSNVNLANLFSFIKSNLPQFSGQGGLDLSIFNDAVNFPAGEALGGVTSWLPVFSYVDNLASCSTYKLIAFKTQLGLDSNGNLLAAGATWESTTPKAKGMISGGKGADPVRFKLFESKTEGGVYRDGDATPARLRLLADFENRAEYTNQALRELMVTDLRAAYAALGTQYGVNIPIYGVGVYTRPVEKTGNGVEISLDAVILYGTFSDGYAVPVGRIQGRLGKPPAAPAAPAAPATAAPTPATAVPTPAPAPAEPEPQQASSSSKRLLAELLKK